MDGRQEGLKGGNAQLLWKAMVRHFPGAIKDDWHGIGRKETGYIAAMTRLIGTVYLPRTPEENV